MNKTAWLLLIACVAVMVFFPFLGNPLDASGDPLYADLLKKELRTSKDLYLVDFGAPGELTIGDYRCISTDLPEIVNGDSVGKRYGRLEVKGFVPKGSDIRISGVNKNINTAAELKGKIEGIDEDIDLSFTQDYRGDTGTFKKGYYEEQP